MNLKLAFVRERWKPGHTRLSLFVGGVILILLGWLVLDESFRAPLWLDADWTTYAAPWTVGAFFSFRQVIGIAICLIGGLVVAASSIGSATPDLSLPEGATPSWSLRSVFQNAPVLWAWTALATAMQLWVVTATLRGKLPPFTVWATGITSLLALAYAMDCKRGIRDRTHDATRLATLIAMVAGLICVGGVLTQKWIPLSVSAGVGSAAWFLRRRWLRISPDENAKDDLPVLLLTAGCFLFCGFQVLSWRWAIIGDEFSFFSLAREEFLGKGPPFLVGNGVYDAHPVLGSVAQAVSLWIYGPSMQAWRLSNVFFVALGVIPLFAFVRLMIDRTAAYAAVLIYASSHLLFVMSKVGSQNTQVMLFLPSVLYATALSTRRGSTFVSMCGAVAVGLGFYTFGTARIFSLIVPLWLVGMSTRLTLRSRLPLLVTNVVVAILIAFPLALAGRSMQVQIQHTLLQSEVIKDNADKLPFIFWSTAAGVFQFLASRANMFWINGPHCDVFVTLLMLIGFGYAFGRSRAWRRLGGVLLLIYLVLQVFVNGAHKYGYPPLSRSFLFVVFYAIVGGIGFRYCVLSIAGKLPEARRAVFSLAALVLLASLVFPANYGIALGRGQRTHFYQQFLLKLVELLKDHRQAQVFGISDTADEFYFAHYLASEYGYRPPTLLAPDKVVEGSPICQAPVAAAFVRTATVSSPMLDRLKACWPDAELIPERSGEGGLYGVEVWRRAALDLVQPR